MPASLQFKGGKIRSWNVPRLQVRAGQSVAIRLDPYDMELLADVQRLFSRNDTQYLSIQGRACVLHKRFWLPRWRYLFIRNDISVEDYYAKFEKDRAFLAYAIAAAGSRPNDRYFRMAGTERLLIEMAIVARQFDVSMVEPIVDPCGVERACNFARQFPDKIFVFLDRCIGHAEIPESCVDIYIK